jgi:hypothetical protein
MPRVILTEGFTKFIAILGVRPDDPYFCLKNLPAKYPYIEFERGYYKIPVIRLALNPAVVVDGRWRFI